MKKFTRHDDIPNDILDFGDDWVPRIALEDEQDGAEEEVERMGHDRATRLVRGPRGRARLNAMKGKKNGAA